MNMELWYTENQTENVNFSMKVKNHLYSAESDFQKIDIIDTYEFGRVLVRVHWYLGKILLSSTMIFHSKKMNEEIKKTIIRVINETNSAFVEGRFNEA